MRSEIIKAGVNQLRESYPGITADNIMTDEIYREFFKACLEQTKDSCPANAKGRIIRAECDKILKEMAS